jgi:hypothetical protein
LEDLEISSWYAWNSKEMQMSQHIVTDDGSNGIVKPKREAAF